MKKLITVNGKDYLLIKNPHGGWDAMIDTFPTRTLVCGYSIKEIKQLILSK